MFILCGNTNTIGKDFFFKERMLRTGMTLSGNLEFAILWLLILENKFY